MIIPQFFQQVANGNRMRKIIDKLKLDNGMIVDDEAIIEREIVSVFANLYSGDGRFRSNVVRRIVFECSRRMMEEIHSGWKDFLRGRRVGGLYLSVVE